MLKLKQEFIQQVNSAVKLEELHAPVQHAIVLEHSTIPPYLTALFSLKPGTNPEARNIIHSIVMEEMLHMTIASNILNALGGRPQLNSQPFVPAYPGPLPMGIGEGLVVGLEAYSPAVAKNIFMEIEEPEDPLVLKAAFEAPAYHTIGEFYTALQQKINDLAPASLPGDPAYQVTSPFFPPGLLFPILTREDAIYAINIIVEQGEGTPVSPIDQQQEIAHYYRFEELYRGRKLVKDPSAPHGFSFTGEAIPFNAADVYPLFPNTKTAMLPAGSEEKRRLDEFNASYFSLLNGLHLTFNGNPDNLANTIGVMYDLKLSAQKLCATPFPGKAGYTIGPSFEYVPVPFLLPV
jgi:hypothetical protein